MAQSGMLIRVPELMNKKMTLFMGVIFYVLTNAA
jgi:hypothetical protein